MTLQAQLTASLVAGPAATSDTQFPSGVRTIVFGLNPPTKQYSVEAGGVEQINSPSPGFQEIKAVGATGQVTQAQTFYARAQTQMILKLTFADPNGGGDLVVTEPLYGVKFNEYPVNGYLKKLEVQGQGQFEFWAAGLQ